jgi:hypothetical protein
MTDLLDQTAASTVFDVCQKIVDGELCAIPLPEGHHPNRKFCDEHQPAASKPKKVKAEPGDVPPRSVNINFKTPTPKKTKADTDAALVREGAEKMLGLLPIVLAVTGDAVCAENIQIAIPQIAAQLGALAEFHPGLKKVFAPMETTGEAMAWIGLAIAVAPVIIGVLVHHNLLSPKMAQTLAVFSTVAAGAGQGGD